MDLSSLEPGVPEEHHAWNDEEYAGRIVVHIGRAGSLYLDAGGDGAAPNEEVQRLLTDALVLAIEWAARRQWPLADDFNLRLDWGAHSFLYLVLRAGEAISATHWAAVNSNPARAMEQLNFSIGCLIDYSRWRGWSVDEAAARAIAARHR